MEQTLEIEHGALTPAPQHESPATGDDLDRESISRFVTSAGADYAAFEELMARHRDHVEATCRSIAGCPSEAEDMAQEIFVKVHSALHRFEHRSTFRTWLGRIKLNHCLNHISSARRRKTVSLGESDLERIVGFVSPEYFVRRRVRDVLAGMGDTLKTPLLMRDHEGMSYRQVADRLDIGVSAAKMRVKRARETFRTLY